MKLYEALGLAPALALDMEDVKKRFYERSRQWHPDRFSRASAAEQDQALEMTAVLNDAFRTLRDPITRAEYFLKEQGLELSKDAPSELLEEVFELNMALEELREGDASVLPQLESAADNFRAMRSASDTELSRLFTEHDSSPDPATLDQIRATLNRRRYVSNLVRDVEKELHVHSAN
ncbi:MAG: Fe-S protein assembly co-chaperone HscB [Bryobacteraceae bacterium]